MKLDNFEICSIRVKAPIYLAFVKLFFLFESNYTAQYNQIIVFDLQKLWKFLG